MNGKLFTRRNWLLRCSILINVAVILYICSYVMIGSGSNFATGPGYIIQDEMPKTRQVVVNNNMASSSTSSGGSGGGGGGSSSMAMAEKLIDEEKIKQQEQESAKTPESKSEIVTKETQSKPQSQPAPAPPAAEGHAHFVSEEQSPKEKPTSNGGDKHSEAPSDNPNDSSDTVPEAVTFVNNTSPDGYSLTGDDKDLDDRLRSILKCHDRPFVAETLQRGDFWVLKNYIRADHGELKCHESITYTTHGDYTFLDNLIPLLERWNAPVSIAIHAPGTDFTPTLNSIKYLRDCLPKSNFVRQFATFHIYFSTKHIPKVIPKHDVVLDTPYNCSRPAPFDNVTSNQLYKTQKKLLYPVNVGRNIARDSALTHFILASDIELYPNPGLVKKFLEMIARNEAYLHRKSPRVFPLSIFEVEASLPVPKDKTELQELLRTGKAIPFHKRVCSSCHGVPKSKEWMAANDTDELSVFHIGKRVGYFVHWEPIYIGTHADPHYDERLSWEGKSDKMTQGYALCVLDYEFHILDNAFLVHKPGIKVLKKDPRRAMLASKTNQLISRIIYPELKIMYGVRKGCGV